jgi:uncharacterized membrane protein
MATLSFEGETQDEIVRKVRRWLASLDEVDDTISVVEAVDRASELTKDALTVVAQAAPRPIARTEVFKALTRMGYEATDTTKRAVVAGLDALADVGDGTPDSASLMRRIEKARNSVVYEMNSAVAKQILRALRP